MVRKERARKKNYHCVISWTHKSGLPLPTGWRPLAELAMKQNQQHNGHTFLAKPNYPFHDKRAIINGKLLVIVQYTLSFFGYIKMLLYNYFLIFERALMLLYSWPSQQIGFESSLSTINNWFYEIFLGHFFLCVCNAAVSLKKLCRRKKI